MNARRQAPYVFLGQTTSLCGHCHMPVQAKIVREDDSVLLVKRCAVHGVERVRISGDYAYWRRCGDYLKPGDRPLALATRTEYGCPFDCGLCPDHEQHSCLAIIEVNEACNLTCPVCFADSSPGRKRHRPLSEIEQMLDTIVRAEGEPDLVQISGGEPTIHPEFFRLLDAAKARPIRHLMVNTNGIRIANEPGFAERLAAYAPGFEVYLQFDSLRPEALTALRGVDLTGVRRRALDALEAAGLATTLVVTVKNGVNDDEVNAIVEFALGYACVRGVTFQPVQDCGRNKGFDPGRHRVVLSDIRRRLTDGGGPFGDDDIVPLPCNPYQIAIGYGLRRGREILPLGRFVPRETLVAAAPNAISFESDLTLRRQLTDLLNLSAAAGDASSALKRFLCCLPEAEVPAQLTYADTFRVVINEFLDAANFCVGNVKRSCVHFVEPDGRIIPFDTYNLFYREGAPAARRAAVLAS